MRCDVRRLANVSSHLVKSRRESGKLFQTCGATAAHCDALVRMLTTTTVAAAAAKLVSFHLGKLWIQRRIDFDLTAVRLLIVRDKVTLM